MLVAHTYVCKVESKRKEVEQDTQCEKIRTIK